MANYDQWAARHPKAAADLYQMIVSAPWPCPNDIEPKSEAWAQQQIRLNIAKAGGMSWRNNVGATPAKCPDCGEKQRPIRYGLANDSQQLNEHVKSSDIIGAMPVLVTPEMIGTKLAVFTAIEAKRPGWHFTGKGREGAQANWLTLIQKLGGYAMFSTGELKL